jgi:hypothetical protein
MHPSPLTSTIPDNECRKCGKDRVGRACRLPTNLPSLAGFAVAVGLRAGLRSYPPAAALRHVGKGNPRLGASEHGRHLQALLCASSVFVRPAGHDPSWLPPLRARPSITGNSLSRMFASFSRPWPGRSSQHSAVLRALQSTGYAIAAALRPISRTATLSEPLSSAPDVRSGKDSFRYQID